MIPAKEIDGELWVKASDHHQAIKEALAQEQEPVGRFAKFTDGIWRPVTDYSAGVPLYTSPPQRTEPLIGCVNHDCEKCKAQTQEPVALQYPQKDIDWQREQQIKAQASTPPQRTEQEPLIGCVNHDCDKCQAQRTWVGLTDDEVYKIAFALEGEHWRKIADAIEAKLKEKNT